VSRFLPQRFGAFTRFWRVNNRPSDSLPVGTTFRETANATDEDTGEKGLQVDDNFVSSTLKSIAGVASR
jgi:hypothetical protein